MDDYNKFAVDKAECSIVIRQNIEKAEMIAGPFDKEFYPDLTELLKK
ncbi:hypothetical protein [Ruminococcus albus]|nr:hypothetical protein [Ruminococcus albus]